TGGEDHVRFVRAEPALGIEAALRVVWRKSLWAERGSMRSRCPLAVAGWLNEVGGVNRGYTYSDTLPEWGIQASCLGCFPAAGVLIPLTTTLTS
ncbi:hypothetical protein K443DRAFT_114371, partial [Laccaria amethystina LaAM-08-1]